MVAERVEAAELVVDRGCELTGRLVATVGREVVPEDGVVGVAAQVEGEVLLVQVDHGGQGVRLAELGQLVEGRVGTGHVRGVMLVVVQFHDLAGNVRLESCVVVREFRQRVNRHEGPFIYGRVSLVFPGVDDTWARV